MEKNNGKIAIAIVAMFVVALSVVGFTYAYFVANVQGNTKDKSVTVTAGILEIAYDGSQTITAKSLVPGWKSDGKHYFDSAAYVTDKNGKMVYSACEEGETTTITVDGEVKTLNCTDTNNTEANGKLEPVTFTVSTTERNTGDVNYAIILNGISNKLDENDKANFTYALCKGTCAATKKYSDLTDEDVLSKGTVGATGETVQVISGAETLVNGGSQEYQVMLYYNEANTEQKNSGGLAVTATVEVVGIQKDTVGNWVDANGTTIIAKSEISG